MLILTRKEQQRIKIGDDIEIAILKIRGGRVEIGITAPTEQQIARAEIKTFTYLTKGRILETRISPRAYGYIAVPKSHPWYNVDYMEINAPIHEKLSYSNFVSPVNGKPSNLYWIGFYVVGTQSKKYINKETMNLKKHAEIIWGDKEE